MSDEKIIIQTEDLTKIYGMGDAQVRALDGVSLQIKGNEFVAIMGPSGSGKSTLMNIIGCLDRPTSGGYHLAGEDVSKMNKTQLANVRNQRIGFVFQSYNLLAQTSAIEKHTASACELPSRPDRCIISSDMGDRLVINHQVVLYWSVLVEELLTDPNVAYLILVGSIVLTSLALVNPGTGILELLGLVGLILAGVEIYLAEVNWWALLLLLFGVFPFVLAVRRSHKMRYLIVAIASFVVGSAFLFKGDGMGPAVNPFLALIVSVLAGGFMWVVVSKSVEASLVPPAQDLSRLIGEIGEAKTDVHKEGSVQVDAELWSARSDELIPMGAAIRVVARDGFMLEVEPAGKE